MHLKTQNTHSIRQFYLKIEMHMPRKTSAAHTIKAVAEKWFDVVMTTTTTTAMTKKKKINVLAIYNLQLKLANSRLPMCQLNIIIVHYSSITTASHLQNRMHMTEPNNSQTKAQ